MARSRGILLAFSGVVLLTVPWMALRIAGVAGALAPVPTIAISGVAVVGAAFLLTWGAETAEMDVPRSFALAVLAVIAVAPEYAVDALYAWEAGQNPGSPAAMEAANLAVANMTGANRILIGLGWSGIALYALYRGASDGSGVVERDGVLADAVVLDGRIAVEIAFLGAATVYAFLLPLGGGLGALDAAVLVGLYAAYILVVLRGPQVSQPHLGVPGYLQSFPKPRRIATILALFAYSAAVILLAVKPFAKGLEVLGPRLGVSSFFMIQWVAPLASESPEFIACAYLVKKLRSTAAFNALISSKLNQWTLLIGTLVVVYSISLGAYDVLSFNQKQAGEIWLTAAQSFFALTLLVNFRLSGREAVAMLALFALQFIPYFQRYEGLLVFSGVYVLLGLALLVRRRKHLPKILSHARTYARGGEPQIGTATD